MAMRLTRILLLLVALALAPTGCGGQGPSGAGIDRSLQEKLTQLKRDSGTVREQALIARPVVVRFYEARNARHAWDGEDAEQIVRAVRSVYEDGLNPSDYHLAALDRLLSEREQSRSPALEADLDILLTDAVAGMVDHVRYGRVRPITLNPSWNVDPREGAPPLEGEVARIAGAGSAEKAIQESKPNHFIYAGLKGALAQLREIAAKGGWPTVPAGKTIRPGAKDPRIAAIRARLLAAGELQGGDPASTVYDSELRKAVELFQERHRLNADGLIDKGVIDAMNVSAAVRADQVRVNLERARWVLPGLTDDFLLVNLPAFKAYLIRNHRNVWEARTQVGQEGKATPSFNAMMRTVVLNPDWTVPGSIIQQEIAPAMAKDPTYLARKGLVVLDSKGQPVDPKSVDWKDAASEGSRYTLQQPPGTDNALGRVKFLFPNPYSIYLHDTPSKASFEAEKRTFSHGCIRLERPLELAEILLSGQDSWDAAKIRDTLERGETQNVNLEHPLPVVIVYWTVSVGASGEVRIMNDIYGLDPPILAALGPWAGRN